MSQTSEHLFTATLAAASEDGSVISEADMRILKTLIDSFEEVSGNIRGTAGAFSARMKERGITIDELQQFVANTQDQTLIKILGKLMIELHAHHGAHPRSLMGLTAHEHADAAAGITDAVLREVIAKAQNRK